MRCTNKAKKNMCVYCHMLKKIRDGRLDVFLILFFIAEMMLDGI